MKILFWNLKKNSNEEWVKNIVLENDIDIAVFSEYSGTSFENVLLNLENYIWHDGYGGCEKVTLLCKNTIKTSVRREQSRYTLYTCKVASVQYNLVGIHLPAPLTSNADDRMHVIRNIVQDITEQERVEKNRLTIVIGDFNCNPFDQEVIQKDSFNAVLFKEVINAQETIKYNDKKWRRFYNPIINYLSEETGTYGSFYYSSGISTLYWNSFDQVLIRKELIGRLKSIEYLKTINGQSLIKKVKPNDLISDHLPLLVNFTKG